MFRVGRSTAYRSGLVADTFIQVPDSLINNRTLLCQYKVNVVSLVGDGGSPFVIKNSSLKVEWVGTHVGRHDGRAVLRLLGNMYSELGPNLTWDSCAPSYNC